MATSRLAHIYFYHFFRYSYQDSVFTQRKENCRSCRIFSLTQVAFFGVFEQVTFTLILTTFSGIFFTSLTISSTSSSSSSMEEEKTILKLLLLLLHIACSWNKANKVFSFTNITLLNKSNNHRSVDFLHA